MKAAACLIASKGGGLGAAFVPRQQAILRELATEFKKVSLIDGPSLLNQIRWDVIGCRFKLKHVGVVDGCATKIRVAISDGTLAPFIRSSPKPQKTKSNRN